MKDKAKLYNSVPRDQTVIFLRKLFATHEELLHELAPKGFERSIYYYVHHPSLPEAYTEYRCMRIKNYRVAKMLKLRYTFQPLISFDDFAKTYVHAPAHPRREMLRLLGMKIKEVCCSSGIVHNRRGECYLHHESENVRNDIIYNAYVDLIDDTTLGTDQILATTDNYMNYDYYHVYYCIFRFLKAEKADWHFHPDYLIFLKGLETELENEESRDFETYDAESAVLNQIKAASFKEESDEDFEGHGFLNFQDELEHEKENPSAMVRAYYDVYGKWPEGFPPKAEEY
ncbi:hypothetical protein [Arcticibacter tournemirensis]